MVKKIKIKSIILSIIILGTAFNAWASNVYLPKVDLIKGNGPEVYVLELGIRHWIPDIETFNHFNFKWENIKTYFDSTVNSYLQEKDWEKNNDYPEGSLVKGSGPKVYLIELGEKRWIPSPRVFEGNNFGWKYIINIDDDDLDDIDLGENLTLSESNRYPETTILSGPTQGEVLEKSEITFKYSGINPLGETSDLEFETFLTHEDSRWQNQRDDYTEDYDLEQNGAYTFYARAKNEQGYYDPSPAYRSFNMGLSSYYDKIKIEEVSPEEDDFRDDYLILENNEDEIIDITGWTIEVKSGTITIPQAVKKLTYSSCSCSNYNIELDDGDEIIISAGLSPIGKNFRTNKCAGYLDQLSQYNPSLDENCPDLEESEYSHLKSSCQDFIEDLDSCEIPDYSDNFEVSIDNQCTGFLNDKFNYSQCYEDYYQDADFFEGRWRIFLSRSIDIFDDSGDTIILKDNSGLTVDEYSY